MKELRKLESSSSQLFWSPEFLELRKSLVGSPASACALSQGVPECQCGLGRGQIAATLWCAQGALERILGSPITPRSTL